MRAQLDDLRISHSRGADASSRGSASLAREGKEDAEVAPSGAQSTVHASAAPAVESAPRVGSARAPLEVGGGGGSARGGASSDGRSAGNFLRDIPPLGSSAAPSSSRAPHLGAAAGAREAGDGVALTLPEDSRDWPGVSAVRALAEASLADVDAEAVRRAKRELVKRKNAERARALAEMRQDAEVSELPPWAGGGPCRCCGAGEMCSLPSLGTSRREPLLPACPLQRPSSTPSHTHGRAVAGPRWPWTSSSPKRAAPRPPRPCPWMSVGAPCVRG